MKASKRTKWIEIEYWDCGIDSHTHRTEAVASACIEKQEKRSPLPDKKTRYKRQVYAARRVLEGDTFTKVGKDLGISGGRVSQIFDKTMRMARHPSRLDVDTIPEGNYWELKHLRENKEFWLRQIQKMADLWGV
ncbi:hypothetical protein HCU74_08175 [Spongiibacter sp. KMU-166]|uniref:RNA polymerase sigma-70 region 4 domain-containing protein n=1 Tax=Spongiibacter thalassae TaxID=2721624 RepID=A0ABX1GE07_9GAMM|nr:hypothetical protein [Spongiibacter thalassae]NKI17391.1 hypothetical protein [Spongiibacter thalassae]